MLALEPELDVAAAGVLEGVARDLGDRRGDARLVLARRSRAAPRSGARAGAPATTSVLVADRARAGERGSSRPPLAATTTVDVVAAAA